MKKFFLFTNLFFLCLVMGFSTQAKDVGGLIEEDTTWTKVDSPFIVKSHVTVIEDVTLTIQPGVTVKFDKDKILTIHGTLVAKGTKDEMVIFTSNGDLTPGYWGFIFFSDFSEDATFDENGNYTGGCILQYADIQYGGSAKPVVTISLSSPFIADSLVANNSGSGISIDKGSPVIRNCEIKNHNSSGIYYSGDGSSNPIIQNCTISGNSTFEVHGGGIYIASGSLTVQNSTISENFVNYYQGCGGGIYLASGTLTVQNSTFNGNSISGGYGDARGGGVYASGTLTVQNSTFNDNSVSNNYGGAHGGGIYASGTLTVQNSTFSGNSVSARGGAHGGGIYASGTLTVQNSTFSGNSAGQFGGGINADSTVTIEGNTFADNSAGSGGGAINAGGTVTIKNNVFKKDKTGNSAPYGGAIYAYGPTVTMQGNTIIGNTASTSFGGVVRLDVTGTSVIGGSATDANVIKENNGDAVWISGSPAFTYNDVYGNTGFELINGSSSPIDALNCYWGTTKEGAVKAEIWDCLDDPTLGCVTYIPFALTPWRPDDTTPPAAITDLATSSPSATSITLTWTAPGDDGNEGQAKSYDIRYSTSKITDANWDSATQCAWEPAPKPAGEPETFTVTDLSPGTTYYFAMKTADEVPNWSELSNVAQGTTSLPTDETPPAVVTDLAIFTLTGNSVTLKWTAPGDDGDVGTAAQYDIRYSTSEITDVNWDDAMQCTDEPAPQPAGSEETFKVTGLSPFTTYYFAIKTADEVPNWSALSNVVSCKTTAKTGDVSGNGQVTAYDAALILQYVVGMISEFPVDLMGSPSTTSPRNYVLSLPSLTAKAGDRIQVPIAINETGLIAGGVTLKFNPNILRPIKATPDMALNGAFWKANIDLIGEIRFAFAGASGSAGASPFPVLWRGAGGEVMLVVEFEVLPNTEGKISPLILDNITLSDSLTITKINGSVTVLTPNFALLQNFPNPFNPETWIPFQLAQDGDVVIRIYNQNGRMIRSLYPGKRNAGIYVTKERAAYWDGRDNSGERVASGVYYYTLQAGNFSATRKMVIMK